MIKSKSSVLLVNLLKPTSKLFANKYSKIACEKKAPIVVTLTGARSRITQIAGLLLKQCNLIDEIRFFDFLPGSCGTALDLSLIDTNSQTRAYTGLDNLADVLEGSSVVAICGGEPFKPGQDEHAVFKQNADYVRTIALYSAEFNPTGILCVATPPVSAMVPLVSEEYKKASVYDPRRIIGLTTLGVVRANSFIAEHSGCDPSQIMCPIIGGMGVSTCVAVVSQTAAGHSLPPAIQEVIRNKVAQAEKNVLILKDVENAGSLVVSPAYAIARFVTSVARGFRSLFRGYESGFVRQTGHVDCFLPYMSSVIKLGKYGVETIHMPHTSAFESVSLQRALLKLREEIAWGESYITGATPILKPRYFEGVKPCDPVGWKFLNSDNKALSDEILKRGKLIPDR